MYLLQRRLRIFGRILGLSLLVFFFGFTPISPAEASSTAAADRAVDSDDTFFQKLQTKDFRVLTPAECQLQFDKAEIGDDTKKAWLRESLEEATPVPPWTPTGKRFRAVRPQCSAVHLENLMVANGDSPVVQSAGVRDFFQNCNRDLSYFAPPDWYSLLSLFSIRLQFCEHPRIRKVFVRLQDGNIIRGYLAMKPGDQPRPLIIAKCGVFCNVGDAGHRVQIMHLFDEGPFNVLALANITGSDYARDNEHMAVGGFDEGMQMLQLAKAVKQTPLGKYISSIHFTGISLGGQGGLFASYLNKYNYQNDRKPYIGSVLAMCPVVELKPSVTGLFVGGVKGKLARYVFVQELFAIFASVPILGNLFPDLKHVPNNDLPDYVADGALHYYKTYKKEWALPPFTDWRFQVRDDVWAHNSFLSLADGVFETPTLVFASEDDWVVGTDVNAYPLSQKILRSSDNRLQVVTAPRGNHCAFSSVYGWDIQSAFVRGYFLSHSPELLNKRRTHRVAIPTERLPRRPIAWESEDHLSQDFKAKAGKDYFTLNFHVWKGKYEYDIDCWSRSMYQGDQLCVKWEGAKIPYAIFDASWARPPRTQVEADSLTRWLNANLRVVDATGRILHGGHAKPAFFEWTDYEDESKPTRSLATSGPQY